MIRPRLTRHLTLEAEALVADQSGGFSRTWETRGTLWADIKSKSGRETRGPNTTVTKAFFKITVRGAPVGSDARPQAGQRLRGHGRIYVIEAVTEYDPDGRYLTCHAVEEAVV